MIGAVAATSSLTAAAAAARVSGRRWRPLLLRDAAGLRDPVRAGRGQHPHHGHPHHRRRSPILVGGNLLVGFVSHARGPSGAHALQLSGWVLERLTAWPGPFYILTGNWAFIDV
jgi:hypothetical protein